jgi:hypothetical protein
VLTVNIQFEVELKKLISTEIERLREILDQGRAIKDYAEYREKVGEIAALRRVAENYCSEAQTTISKR